MATVAGCQSLNDRAERSNNDRVKALIHSGVDLIAKEAEYHKSCRVQFDKETENKPKLSTAPRQYHNSAFISLCNFVQHEIIDNKRSMLVTSLLDIYRQEYIANGGLEAELVSYTCQALLRKISERFKEKISVTNLAKRTGNILHSSDLTEEDARNKLNDNEDTCKQDERIRWVALYLRSLITQLPTFKTPNPATVQNLKESAPKVPNQLDLFFRYLLNGIDIDNKDSMEVTNRKVSAMASDAIYNVTRGSVRPWKQTVIGLGLASLTGSKLALQILNREGHCINYNAVKSLETEFAYSAISAEYIPDGICLHPGLATACVWDNNDADVETLDGKSTLHSTVGHTYQNVLDNVKASTTPMQFREGRNRRKFLGEEPQIPAFRKPLNSARFVRTSPYTNTETTHESSAMFNCDTAGRKQISTKPLDLYWLLRLKQCSLPLYAGFISNYVTDSLPLQRICFMDPISNSPTRNDVVRETMIRTITVAEETGQNYGVVTYDLAIATKAYAIQAIETPIFDKLLIMLGNFHVELSFFGAVGTFINESCIEFILAESGVLAEGSMVGFIKGKFYNRCIRIHQLLANVLERKLYDCFFTELDDEDKESFNVALNAMPSNSEQMDEYLANADFMHHLQKYETFLQHMLEGSHGPTAQFWCMYIYLINRLHRELQRCVKTNDVAGYIDIFPLILDVFIALNRPNYARWGTLYLQKLKSAPPEVLDILNNGAFSIRRTGRDYIRSAIDLSLEQTVNRDAASQMKGIVAFRNSESAMRRWSLTMAQRAQAVTELRSLVGIDQGETAAVQCQKARIRKDHSQMNSLDAKIDEFCNPFANEVSTSLVNIATGRAASKPTESYLLGTLKRGHDAQKKFTEEWLDNSSRFQKRVQRIPLQNFAVENTKKPKLLPIEKSKKSAESLRDLFIQLIIVTSQETSFDLRKVLSCPITQYPLSLAHCDGMPVKSDKSTLLKKLESFQGGDTTNEEYSSYEYVYDGGLLMHSVLSRTNAGASYASVARSLLSIVCSGHTGKEVHLCFDKYIEKSIKASERKLRGATDSTYIIIGAEQKIRQSGQKLLANSAFKNELAKFLLDEWTKDHYYNIFAGKILYASHGGNCYQYVPQKETQNVSVVKPAYLQGDHEEADTLIAFHAVNICSNIVVRASDTDVLIILIGMLGHQSPDERAKRDIIMDCGMGNNRRFISVTNIVSNLETVKCGLSRAMPGYHAFTGCDFTAAFYRSVTVAVFITLIAVTLYKLQICCQDLTNRNYYNISKTYVHFFNYHGTFFTFFSFISLRKGKVKPFDLLEKHKTDEFIKFFISLGCKNATVDVHVASKYVCSMYAQSKTDDVNEARYNKLLQMSGNISKVWLYKNYFHFCNLSIFSYL